jgi:predicted phage tail protein
MTAATWDAVPRIREVRLYGQLGRRFGRVFRLAVATPSEAVHALRAQLQGFERAFLGADGQQAYHVYVGRGERRRTIGEEEAAAPIGQVDVIRFVPAIAGAKRAGATQTILGYVLFVAGTAITAYSYGTLAPVGTALQQMGYSMMLGGVIQLLSPQRQGKQDRTENLPSYAFDGPVNNTEQGGPVPLRYGRVICGSTVVSQGLSTVEIYVPPPAPMPEPELPPYEGGGPGNDGGTGGDGGPGG